MDKVKEQVEKQIQTITETGVATNNIDYLYKLIDIHKDLANEEYWKEKKEVYKMRYNDYGDYNEGGYGRRGVPGTGRRRYSGYGRRGVPGSGRGRYRGEEMIEEMQEHFGNYSEAIEEFDEGNYGAETGMIKSAKGIMENVYSIIEELAESNNPEVMQIIKKYSKKISEMD